MLSLPNYLARAETGLVLSPHLSPDGNPMFVVGRSQQLPVLCIPFQCPCNTGLAQAGWLYTARASRLLPPVPKLPCAALAPGCALCHVAVPHPHTLWETPGRGRPEPGTVSPLIHFEDFQLRTAGPEVTFSYSELEMKPNGAVMELQCQPPRHSAQCSGGKNW